MTALDEKVAYGKAQGTPAEVATTLDGTSLDDRLDDVAQPESAEVLELAAPDSATVVRRGPSRKLVLIAAAAVVTILAVVGGTLVAMTKTVTITVDGETRTLTTLAGTVGAALDAADVVVGEHDTLAPATEQSITDGFAIVVNRGRQLTLTIDGHDVTIWTTARTVDEAMAELGRDPSDYQLSADRARAIPLEGLSITADTLYQITLDDKGARRTVSTVSTTVADFLEAEGVTLGVNDRVSPVGTTLMSSDTVVTVVTLPTVTVTDGVSAPLPLVSGAATLADLFAATGITLNPQDSISLPLNTPLSEGLAVSITRVTTTQVTQTVETPQPAGQSVKDSSLPVGTNSVAQEGRPGQQVVVFDVVLSNGVEVSRTEVSRTESVPALPTITHVGTKVITPVTPPPAATPATPATPPASGGTEYVGGKVYFHDFEFGVNWDGLAKCESGNNPRAINPSGKYTGMFQFDDRTWQSVGGSGRSYDAPAEEQLMRAKLLYQSRGLQPWACAWAG